MVTFQDFLLNIPYFYLYSACAEYWRKQNSSFCADRLGEAYDAFTTLPCTPEDTVLLLPEASDQYQTQQKICFISLKEMRNLKKHFGVNGILERVNSVISECEKRENSQRIPVNFPTSPENAAFPSLYSLHNLRWEDLPGIRIYTGSEKRKKEEIAAALLYAILELGGDEKEFDLAAEWREHIEKNKDVFEAEENPRTFKEIEESCREYRRVFTEVYKNELKDAHVLHPYRDDKWR